jgi:molybdenum-dependent DNA-binding transcriptional regulator ModE
LRRRAEEHIGQPALEQQPVRRQRRKAQLLEVARAHILRERRVRQSPLQPAARQQVQRHDPAQQQVQPRAAFDLRQHRRKQRRR